MVRHRRVLALAASAALIVLGLTEPAGAVTPAAEGSFPIELSGCHVTEEIELQGSPAHDYMRWETTSNSTGCEAAIYTNGAEVEHQDITTSGYHVSGWYYDGPGDTDQVCVSSGDAGKCGPAN
ncbi:hypothetical protein [Streptantibioticus silvisoli]|uniref:Uncharacterized protein n=1 Tax=Streptantibioticus silvisoli TaxID=2705255 RepID=A0ABT6W155_9ACTN|nr:hypothetical protein [Streptantibioticus silvisoli]MDI5964477.1 hypothetical protein [Streptantibioticus silvisoli]